MGSDPIEQAASVEATKLAGEIKGGHLGAAISEINEWRQEVGKTCFQATMDDLNWELHKDNILPNLDVVDANGNKLVVQEHDGDHKFTLGPDSRLTPLEPPNAATENLQQGSTTMTASARHDVLKGSASIAAPKEDYPYGLGVDVSNQRSQLRSGVDASGQHARPHSAARAGERAPDLHGGAQFTNPDTRAQINVSLQLKADQPDGPVNTSLHGKVKFASGQTAYTDTGLQGQVVTENGRRYFEGAVYNPYLGNEPIPNVRIELRQR